MNRRTLYFYSEVARRHVLVVPPVVSAVRISLLGLYFKLYKVLGVIASPRLRFGGCLLGLARVVCPTVGKLLRCSNKMLSRGRYVRSFAARGFRIGDIVRVILKVRAILRLDQEVVRLNFASLVYVNFVSFSTIV